MSSTKIALWNIGRGLTTHGIAQVRIAADLNCEHPENIETKLNMYGPRAGHQNRLSYCFVSGPDLLESLFSSTIVTLCYVGILYMPWARGNRDAPQVIIARIASVFCVAVANEQYVQYRFRDLFPLEYENTYLKSSITSAMLTLLLYTGHLAVHLPNYYRAIRSIRPRQPRQSDILAMRDFFISPIIEEVVFRRQSDLFWACQSRTKRILCPAALFSLAHGHHVLQYGSAIVLLQMSYTMFFGVYASILYIHTNHLIAPIIAHCICNLLGLPDFQGIAKHKRSLVISIGYVASVAVFVYIVFVTPSMLAVRPQSSQPVPVAIDPDNSI